MAFQRPTLPEIVTRVQADFVSRLNLVTPILRRSMVYVLSRVIAGASHLLHAHLQFLSEQIFPDQSEAEYLERQAALYGLSRLAATYAQGNVTLTGTNGSVAPTGTVLQRADGQQYVTLADGTIAAGTATVAIQALTAGLAANASAADPLNLITPIAGISSAVVVAAGGLTNGADTESDEGLRARLLLRLQEPPLGGAVTDYVAWALSVSGVTRAWVYPMELGPGTVTVRFVTDDVDPIIPIAGKVAEVQAYIDARRPVTASVTVVAPVAVPVNFTIAVMPNTAAVKTAVESELKDLLRRDAFPGGTILLSRIREAVSVAAGESDNAVTVPAANVVMSTGQIATMGVITWV
jgi:uncharacterized phage protein gp47/JayE